MKKRAILPKQMFRGLTVSVLGLIFAFMLVPDAQSQSELRALDRADNPAIEQAARNYDNAIRGELSKLRNNELGYSKLENAVRIQLLEISSKKVAEGLNVNDALFQAGAEMKENLLEQGRGQNVDLRSILDEYQNRFY